MTSIIITVRGRQSHLVKTVESVIAETNSEIIVVHMNQPASYAHPRVISAEISSETDLCVAKARNYGAQLASSDTLIFLDVDCFVQPGFVENYVKHRSETKIVMGRCFYEPTLYEHSKRNTLMKPTWELFWSLSFMIERSLFNKLGGFDEQFVGYGVEDTDFAYRAYKAGLKFEWAPWAMCVHQYHEPSKQVFAESFALNQKRFQIKHPELSEIHG